MQSYVRVKLVGLMLGYNMMVAETHHDMLQKCIHHRYSWLSLVPTII
ncbi:hypothetical protein [Streptococcus anginosus]|nr:hypothetical protein [Streptococcus anginosus]